MNVHAQPAIQPTEATLNLICPVPLRVSRHHQSSCATVASTGDSAMNAIPFAYRTYLVSTSARMPMPARIGGDGICGSGAKIQAPVASILR
jgi:hypothetical protein